MKVSVAYAEARNQVVVELDVDGNVTVEQAVGRSGILAKFPDVDLTRNKLGIYGKLVQLDQVLTDGDRVEIYRPALGKPPKKEREPRKPAAGAAAKPAAGADGAQEDKAAKMAAIKARAAAAKAKMAAAKGGEAAPAAADAAPAEPAPEVAGGDADQIKAAKMAAARARAAAAKARMAAKKISTAGE